MKDTVVAVADKIAAMVDRIGMEIERDSKESEVKTTNSAGDNVIDAYKLCT